MQHDTSKSAAPKRQRRHGYWTDARKRAVLRFATTHGHRATLEKFRISGSQLHDWRALPREKSNGRVPMSTYAVARKLQGAIRERLRDSGELGDVEIYGTLLIREILKGA